MSGLRGGGLVFAGLGYFLGWLVRVGSPPAVVGWVGSACPLPLTVGLGVFCPSPPVFGWAFCLSPPLAAGLGVFFCPSPPGVLGAGRFACRFPLGVAGFFEGDMVYRPSLFGGAVNLLGVISFSIYGFGVTLFFVILYLFG